MYTYSSLKDQTIECNHCSQVKHGYHHHIYTDFVQLLFSHGAVILKSYVCFATKQTL